MDVKFYKVGGAVRDEILKKESKDIDFAVEASSFEEMESEIKKLGGDIFLSTPKFFTIRAKVPSLGIADYVLCRKDGAYRDGRHPDSVEMGTIFDDLSRRDFTMNAIAVDISNNKIIDPHDGYRDIKNKLIRCVGNTAQRLSEDALRAFRAIRFCVQKDFNIDYEILDYINSMKIDSFVNVSTERIREELYKMFSVNTKLSFGLCFSRLPIIGEVIISRNIWFEPTTKEK